MREYRKAYDALGNWFEYLNDDCGYENWSQYLISILNGYGFRTGIDIGCGNGYFTRALERAGYCMTGMDNSLAMLNRAKQLAAKEGVRAQFLLGDILKLKLPERVDFALAINDCINYIPPEKCALAFQKVAGCLKKGGVFLFDISSEYKLRQKVANNSNVDDRDDVTYLSFNTLDGNRVRMEITLFVRQADGRYERLDEQQIQYIHTENNIASALQKAGLELLSVTGHLGEPKEQSDRLQFICRR